ncbi:MAG: GldM family protein, partial [Bacteroidota bacterium]|nr:GldM family protein [Bacteroidota bacterium]
ERTTTNFNLKNQAIYFDFDNAATNNPQKYAAVKDQAYLVKEQADEAVAYIQEMKYQLVRQVDKNKVYLGNTKDVIDEKGKPKKELAIEDKKYSELTDIQKSLPIAYLSNKDNREASGQLFFPTNLAKDKRKAAVLKKKIEEYRDLLLELAGDNQDLINEINMTCDVSDKGSGKKQQSWEVYNFVDMPSVGALTILSKIQSDMRNIEAGMIDYLKKDIDAKSLKFAEANGIQIPKSNFVLKGDTFRSQIFVSASNPEQNPDIYVGEYDSLGGGIYQMKGEEGIDYETVKVVNGKGMFATRTKAEGVKKWGGLIAMKTETGTKYYPFSGEYLVAARTAVISPVNMNVLYLEVDNPLEVSVPGYTAGEVTAVINNGKILATKKSLGEWSARPSKKGKAIVSLYANVEGKRTKMGDMDFRVKEVPPPKPKVDFTKLVNGSLITTKAELLNAGGVQAKLEDFIFKGVRYIITSYRLTGVVKGEQTYREVQGGKFSDQMLTIIKNTKAGNSITISNIKAKRIDYKNNKEVLLESLIIELK